MPHFSEEIIMSVLTSIFQAIFQSITWLLFTSESAYSSIFHDFTGRFTGECSALTGVVHIGIAIGICISAYKIMITNSAEFVSTALELVTKKKPFKSPKPAREFMYMTVVSFLPMILWLIPTGKSGFLYNLLRMTGFNKTLLDDGIFLAITGALLLLAFKQHSVNPGQKRVTLVPALVVGFSSLLLVPVSGLSLVAGVAAILILFGVSDKLVYRYCVSLSVPTLLVMGIIEVCVSTTTATVVQNIIGILLSAVVAFFCTRVFRFLLEKAYYNYFGIYNLGLGAIVAVIGIVELFIR